MADPIRFKRGTRAQINAAAAANGLVAGEPYLITDEARFALASANNAFQGFLRQDEFSNSIVGSRAVVASTLADGTTLGTTHLGRAVKVNGGTINLPADANWAVNEEIEFIVVGTSPTILQWTGNAIVAPDTGSATAQVIGGGIGNAAIVKKMAAGVAYLFAGNVPQNFSIYDPQNRALILPGAGSTISQVGASLTLVGTTSHPQPAAGTAYTEAHRWILTSAATAAALSSMRSATLRLWRGNAAGKGGFKVSILFGLATMQAGQRAFFGIDSNTAAATNIDPLTAAAQSKIGMAINVNTGNWNLINNVAGTTPTVLALGANFPVDTTTLYELILTCSPNGSAIAYRITNKNTGSSVSGSLTSNIPAATTFMHLYCWITNNATAAAVAPMFGKIAMEFN